MAKETNGSNKNLKWIIGILVTIFSTLLGVVFVVSAGQDAKLDEEKLDEQVFKTFVITDDLRAEKTHSEGTMVCGSNELRINSVEKDVEYLGEAVDSFRLEQKATREESKKNFKELLIEIKKR